MGIGDVRNGTDSHAGRGGRARRFALLPALALLLAGCAGNGVGGGDGNDGPMGAGNAGDQGLFGSSMQTTTVAPTAGTSAGGTSGAGTAAVVAGDADPSDFTCPPIQVRAGAAAWQVTEPQDGGVRYQATLGQFSRECRFTSPDMNMRVGIQGRVLLGPKGGPGKLTVPIRLAVVEEGPAPKTVWTKFYAVPVEVGERVMQVDFGLVADDVNFPRPTPALSERYIVYVGFDPQGKEEKPARQQRPPAQATRPRPQQQAPKPRQTQTAPAASPTAAPASTPPRASTSAPTPAVQAAPSAPVQTPAPASSSASGSSANDGQTQWIGAPAPSTGGFSQ